MQAISPGGTSIAPDAEYGAALASTLAVAAGGLGPLSASDAARALAGRTTVAIPAISELATNLTGTGSRQDLETLFQVIHLRFVPPNPDVARFESGKSQTKALLAGRRTSPDAVFETSVNATLWGNDPRGALPSDAEIDAWPLEPARAFYRDRFADAANFTFIFVGGFDLDTMRPLVERYLASLPSTGAHETWRDRGIRTPEGIVARTIHAGREPKARIALIFNGPFQYDPASRAAAAAVGLALQSKLFTSIRERLGATYAVSVSTALRRAPQPIYIIRVQWDCDPARVDELVARVLSDVDDIKQTLLPAFGLANVRAALLRPYDAPATNAVVLGQLVFAYQNGDDASDPDRMQDAIHALDASAIREAARMYLDTGRYVKVVMLPE
jgi:zinc protease